MRESEESVGVYIIYYILELYVFFSISLFVCMCLCVCMCVTMNIGLWVNVFQIAAGYFALPLSPLLAA